MKIDAPTGGMDRGVSVDSSEFVGGDEYDHYDDFGLSSGKGGGSGGRDYSKMSRTETRNEKRGGSGGGGCIRRNTHG